MKKITKRLSLVITLLFTVFSLLSYLPVSAASVTPQIAYANQPKLEYTVGESVNFDLYTPNYGGRVQYRVVLWEDSKKSYRDLWQTAYYNGWQPYGNEIFNLHWPIYEPGSYRITIYVKRAGIDNKKTNQPFYNCDSYMESKAFIVKVKDNSSAALTDAYTKVSEYEAAPIGTLEEIGRAEVLKQPAVTAVANITSANADKKAALETRIEKKAAEIQSAKIRLSAFGVASVNAVNAIQVLVKFNNPVKESSAEVTTKYSIGNMVPVKAELQEDKMSVLLTMGSVIKGNNVYVVQPVESASNPGTITPLYTYNETYWDNTPPYVVKVTYPTLDTAKIIFSEPIVDMGNIVFTQDGMTIMLTQADVFRPGDSSITYSLVNVATDKPINTMLVGVKDYAGNYISPNPSNTVLTRKGDGTPTPVLLSCEVKTIDYVQYLVLHYDRNIRPSFGVIEGTRSDTYGSFVYKSDVISPIPYTISNRAGYNDPKAVMVNIGNFPYGQYSVTIPEGFVFYDSSIPSEIRPSLPKRIVFTRGLALYPEIGGTTVMGQPTFSSDNSYLTVIFAREVDLASALNLNNYKVDGVTIFSNAIIDGDVPSYLYGKVVKLYVMPGTIQYEGNRLFTISNMKDTAGYVMEEYQNILYIPETNRPYVASARFLDTHRIQVTFSEKVKNTTPYDFEVYIGGIKVDPARVVSAYSSVPTNTTEITLIDPITDLYKTVQIILNNVNMSDESNNKAMTGVPIIVAF